MSPSGDERNLRYPLDDPQDLGSETPDSWEFLLPMEWQTEDSDEEVDIVLRLSLNELVALATTIDVGRDIAYGENSDYIWALWSKSIVSTDICQSIIDCINNPESGVAQAIFNVANETSYSRDRELSQGMRDENLVYSSNPDCDYDILFGQCMQLVEYLDVRNKEMLNLFEVATNAFELASQVLPDSVEPTSAIADNIIDWVVFVQNAIEENYDAQATVAYKEECACQIFCVAIANDCKIEPVTLYEIWQARISATVDWESLVGETILYLVSGTWIGSEIADFMFFSQLAFRAQLGQWLGNTVAFLDLYTRLAVYANDPNGDWNILCDECDADDWEKTFLFGSAENFNPACLSINIGTTSGDELVSSYNGQQTALRFTLNIPDDVTCTEIEIEYDDNHGGNDVGLHIRIGTVGDEDEFMDVAWSHPAGQQGDDKVWTIEDVTLSNLTYYARSAWAESSGNERVRRVTFRGLRSQNGGVDPFESSDC